MEAFGTVAAAIGLAQLAGKLAKKAWKITRRLHQAPQELECLRLQLLTLESELSRIETVTSRCVIPTDLTAAFETILGSAEQCIDSLDDLIIARHPINNVAARFQWVFKDRKQANRVLTQMSDLKSQLSSLMQITLVNYAISTFTSLEDFSILMKQGIAYAERILYQVQALSADQGQALMTITAQDSSPSAVPLLPMKKPRAHIQLRTAPWIFDGLRKVLGLRVDCISMWKDGQDHYLVSIVVRLPLLGGVPNGALLVACTIRRHPKLTGRYNLSNVRCGWARRVSKDHRLMRACKRNDAASLRNLLGAGEGHLTDIDEEHHTPLAVAILHGSPQVVEEIIDQCPGLIDEPVGELQSTPLQLAIWSGGVEITRKLLNAGASQDHVNQDGWNALFFCWPEIRFGGGSKVEFVKLLQQDSYQDLQATDRAGWSALHRAASIGLPEEIMALIGEGANLRDTSEPLGWNALHYATFYGNCATLDILISEIPAEEVRAMIDDRGWSLLHIAAECGHVDMIHRLLELGVDPLRRSRPYSSRMPAVLYHGRWTPLEVAAAQGGEKRQRFLQVIRQFQPDFPDIVELPVVKSNWVTRVLGILSIWFVWARLIVFMIVLYLSVSIVRGPL